jgi:hypothetical protein
MAAISNYGTLKTEIENIVNRSDLDTDIPLWIQLGQLRIYREVRARAFESSFSTAISSGVIALPTGYLDLKYAYIDGSPARSLERKDAEWILYNYPTRSADSKPAYIARDGTNFIFGPYPDSAYTVKGVCYAKLTAFSADADANWFTTDGADLMLFAALTEGFAFIQDDANAQKWDARYEFTKRRIQVYEEQEEFSGSPLVVSVR